MDKFLMQNFKDVIASLLIVICLLALIIGDGKISGSLSQFLQTLITACIGYLIK